MCAAVMAMEASLGRQGSNVRLAVEYLHEKCNQLDGHPWADRGTQAHTMVSVMSRYGVPLESVWPYSSSKPKRLPKGLSWRRLDDLAERHRANIYPVTSYKEIPDHLRLGRPILASFAVHQSWYDAKADGRIPPIAEKSQFRGRSMFTIIGWDPGTGVLHLTTSWPNWGNHGRGSMTPEAAEMLLVSDEMWAVEVPITRAFRWSAEERATRPGRR